MSHPEISQPTEPLPSPQAEAPKSTFGYGVVNDVDRLVYHNFEAAQAEDNVARADELLSTKVHPNNRLKHLGSRLTGKAMNLEEAAVVNSRADEVDYAETQKQYATDLDEAIKEVDLPIIRRKLAFLDEEQQDRVNDYLDKNAAPGLRTLKGQAHKKLSWVSWLSNKEHASDDQLINFLQWNVAKNAEQQQNPDFKEAVEHQRAHYKKAVAQAVHDGWFSKKALDNLEHVDEVPVLVGDPVEMILRNIRGQAHLGEIIIAPPEVADRSLVEEVEAVLPHEFNHAVIQTARHPEELGERWIMECLTEISARIIRPNRVSGVYPNEQQLYFTLLKEGSLPLEASLGTRAYTGDDAERQAFYNALDSSWGATNTLGKVSEFILNLQKSLSSKYGAEYSHQITQHVLEQTNKVLIAQPEYIFGEEYKKPNR